MAAPKSKLLINITPIFKHIIALFWAGTCALQVPAQSSFDENFYIQLYEEIDSNPEKILKLAQEHLIKYSPALNSKELTYLHHIISDCFYYLGDIPKSDSALILAIQYAPEDLHESKLVELYNSHGQNLSFLGKLDESIAAYKKGLQKSKAIKDSIEMANLYFNIGSVFYSKSELLHAMSYLDSSQAVSIALQDELGLSSLLRLKSSIYKTYGDYKLAKATSSRGLALGLKLDPHLSCFHLLDLANLFYTHIPDPDSMLSYLNDAKKCLEYSTYVNYSGEYYKTLGNYLDLKLDTLAALAAYDSSATIMKSIGDQQGYFHARLSAEILKTDTKNLDEALSYADKALELKMTRLAGIAYNRLAHRLAKAGKDREGFAKLALSEKLLNEYNLEDTKRRLTLQETQFQVAEQKMAVQLAQENLKFRRAQYLAVLSLLLTLGTLMYGFMVYRHKKSKLKLQEEKLQQETVLFQRLSEVESQAFRAQMNPHFIFNALGSIKGLIVNGQNQEAAIYISKFSKLVRRVLENSINKVISLKEELEVLDMYIRLEQLRFRDGFDYILNINATLDTDSLSIPPVLLQPFVENAIWHGFKNNPKQNILTLSLSSNNGD